MQIDGFIHPAADLFNVLLVLVPSLKEEVWEDFKQHTIGKEVLLQFPPPLKQPYLSVQQIPQQSIQLSGQIFLYLFRVMLIHQPLCKLFLQLHPALYLFLRYQQTHLPKYQKCSSLCYGNRKPNVANDIARTDIAKG